ncbi:N-acetylglucosamine-6-phosphate deacetylase [Butyrivibrio sp. AD3002]|uniref:N-acetylglucosamine-6-phosphate deacetylase n=1 Tax=Butyrivibrio sp. AD3002 TaxID=1280670 RepID=UPI0003B30DB4|nr:N-acetylglucosamine-6-phosphate deacetylase [Butyrivibrio sp. AD3002]
MRVTGGLVFDNNFRFVEKDIFTDGEFFVDGAAAVKESEATYDDKAVDASGCYVIPGLVDIHVHGCMGSDFCDGSLQAIEKLLTYEASCGVTAICPTTMTVSKEKLLKVADATREFFLHADSKDNTEEFARKKSLQNKAHFIGINMEGPFISPKKKGSQELSDIIAPDVDFAREMIKRSGGKITLIDIAPETEGAMDFIRELAGEVTISIAHTDCDYNTAMKAMNLGAHHVTHLYNAMSPFLHRAPGVVGAAADDPECMVELITDGVHHHHSVDRNTFRLIDKDRIVLISDSMRATGLPDGSYELGGHEVHVEGKRALLSDGTIAASVTNLYDCMITLVKEIGIPLETAVQCATINPAKSVHADDKLGSITPGKYADFLLVDKDTLELKAAFCKGKCVI